MILHVVLAIALLAAVQVASTPRQETATVRGRLTDRASGAPIARGTVTLLRARERGQELVIHHALTNDRGEFELSVPAPAAYDLLAGGAEFRARHAQHHARQITLTPGEVRELAIALSQTAAISGRVLDENGLPLTGAEIAVYDALAGHRVLSGQRRQTDDRGYFRVFGLSPGRYSVCAEAPRSLSFTDQSSRPRFVTTCFPDALSPSVGEPIELGEVDREGLDIRMRRQPTFRVSGVVVDSSGALATDVMIDVSRLERGSWGTANLQPSGRFTVSRLLPGRYHLTARIGAGFRSGDPREVEVGTVAIDVNGHVDGVVVAMKRAVRVRGVIRFEDAIPPEFRPETLAVEARSPLGSYGPGTREPAPVRQDLTFEVAGLFGPVVLAVRGLPPGMAVRTVQYRNQNVVGIPTEFDGDPNQPVTIVVTSRVAEVLVRVTDAAGRPASAHVAAFPADRARWNRGNLVDVASEARGTYRLRDLPPGEYLVAAIAPVDSRWMDLWNTDDPAVFARVAAVAERVAVFDNDRRTLDLPVSRLAEDPGR